MIGVLIALVFLLMLAVVMQGSANDRLRARVIAAEKYATETRADLWSLHDKLSRLNLVPPRVMRVVRDTNGVE